MSKIIFRKESFGGIFYEPKTGKFSYANQVAAEKKLTELGGGVVIHQNPLVEGCFLSAPEEIGIDITQECNLRCTHCYKDSSTTEKNELTTKELFSIADQSAELGVFCFYLSGGEATCRKDLFDFVDYAKSKGIWSVLTTNGCYGKEIWDKIVKANFLKLQISVDGPKEIHDSIRGKGNFDRVIETIKYLKSSGVNLRINTHLCKINKDYAGEMVALANGLGVGIKFATVRPIGRYNNSDVVEMLTKKEFYETIKIILELKKKYSAIQVICDFDKLVAKESLYVLPGTDNSRCLAADKTMCIDSIGNVFPCSFFSPFKEFCGGNIREKSIVDIWSNSAVFKKFRVRKASPECEECKFFKKSCNGGCPAIPAAVYGSPEKLDPTCPVECMR